jgi:hypothetical protein
MRANITPWNWRSVSVEIQSSDVARDVNQPFGLSVFTQTLCVFFHARRRPFARAKLPRELFLTYRLKNFRLVRKNPPTNLRPAAMELAQIAIESEKLSPIALAHSLRQQIL